MRIILFLILILSPHAFAQKSLGRESFMVNVRPVLNGILGDFYQMVTLFPDFPHELIPVIQGLDELTPQKELLRSACPRRIDAKCKATIDDIRIRLARLRTQTMVLLNAHKLAAAPYVNSLAGLRIVTEFDGELEEVKGLLDNSSFLIAAQIPQKRETYFILKELDELNTLLSLAVVEHIPFPYKEDFRHFFFNFVHPIQQQISKNNNHEYVNKNITALNFAVNLLNQTLTKKKKTPEGMGPFLATIHNRWNSLLRYYF
jgi:hypothetical protein